MFTRCAAAAIRSNALSEALWARSRRCHAGSFSTVVPMSLAAVSPHTLRRGEDESYGARALARLASKINGWPATLRFEPSCAHCAARAEIFRFIYYFFHCDDNYYNYDSGVAECFSPEQGGSIFSHVVLGSFCCHWSICSFLLVATIPRWVAFYWFINCFC